MLKIILDLFYIIKPRKNYNNSNIFPYAVRMHTLIKGHAFFRSLFLNTLSGTGAKPILGPICMIPYIFTHGIKHFGPQTGLAPVLSCKNQVIKSI